MVTMAFIIVTLIISFPPKILRARQILTIPCYGPKWISSRDMYGAPRADIFYAGSVGAEWAKAYLNPFSPNTPENRNKYKLPCLVCGKKVTHRHLINMTIMRQSEDGKLETRDYGSSDWNRLEAVCDSCILKLYNFYKRQPYPVDASPSCKRVGIATFLHMIPEDPDIKGGWDI